MKDIKLRLAAVEDAERILEIYMPYVLNTAITFEWEVPSLSEFRQRIEDIAAVYPYLVCEADGRIVAYAYAHRYLGRAAYAWTAELSVYVEEAYCRRSIGTALYTALTEILRLQNVRNLYALVSDKNEKSFALHRKIGFEKIAVYNKIGYKFNRWHNVAVFEMLLGEHCDLTPSIVPFPNLEKGQVEAVLAKCQGLIKADLP